MNKRKEPVSKQPGIDSFFSKSQRIEGNEGPDKAACQRRPANVASVPSATSAVRVHSVSVDVNVMLKTLGQNFPESTDGEAFHSYYHCREKRCLLNEPTSSISSNSKGKAVCFELLNKCNFWFSCFTRTV